MSFQVGRGTDRNSLQGIDSSEQQEPLFIKVAWALCLCFVVADAGGGDIAGSNQGQSLKIAAIGTSLTAVAPGLHANPWFVPNGEVAQHALSRQSHSRQRGWAVRRPRHPTTWASPQWTEPPQDGGPGQLDLALANNPDAIFIEFSMNDAVTGGKQPFGITLEMSRNNLQTMINKINTWATAHHKTVDIVLQTMNNESGGLGGARPNLPAYYQVYRDVAKANGLLLVDNYPAWESLYRAGKKWLGYVPDGVHPTAEGTDTIIMPNIRRALLGQVPKPGTVALPTTGTIFLVMYACRKRKSICDF